MTGLDHLLSPARVMHRVDATSKKRIFQLAAQNIAQAQAALMEPEVYSQLLAREKLGSTGLGHGVAIPHCRVDGCEQPVGCLITLETPVDFGSPDGQPVDLLFVLLVPSEAAQAHLDLLAELAGRFSQADYCSALRKAASAENLLLSAQATHASAMSRVAH